MAFKFRHIFAKAVFGAGFAFLTISIFYDHFQTSYEALAMTGSEVDTSSLEFLQSISVLLFICLLLAGYAAATVFGILWSRGRLVSAFLIAFAVINPEALTAIAFAAFAGAGELGLGFWPVIGSIFALAVLLWAPVLDIINGVSRLVGGEERGIR